MRRRRGWTALAAAVVLAHACGGSGPGHDPEKGGPLSDSESAAIPADSGSAVAAATTPTAVPAAAPDAEPAQAPSGPPEASATPAYGDAPLTSLQTILAGGAQAGSRVRVEGLCIGYARVVAVGPQPRTRSDWQLVQDSVAAWVVGPYPPGCSGSVPAAAPGTYTVTVAVDTLPVLGDGLPRPRFYLIHSPLG